MRYSIHSVVKQRARHFPYVATILDEFGWPAMLFEGSQIRAKLEEWCQANCCHEWIIERHFVLFESQADAMLLRLIEKFEYK